MNRSTFKQYNYEFYCIRYNHYTKQLNELFIDIITSLKFPLIICSKSIFNARLLSINIDMFIRFDLHSTRSPCYYILLSFIFIACTYRIHFWKQIYFLSISTESLSIKMILFSVRGVFDAKAHISKFQTVPFFRQGKSNKARINCDLDGKKFIWTREYMR